MLWCEHVFVPGRLFYLYTGNFILSVLIHTYIHTCIHAYMHTCIHTYSSFTHENV